MAVAHIHDLPDEILVKIFKYLDYFALFSVSKTCKRFERFYSDPLITRYVYNFLYIIHILIMQDIIRLIIHYEPENVYSMLLDYSCMPETAFVTMCKHIA